MKRFIIHITLTLFGLIIVYISFAYVNLEVNPCVWLITVRQYFVAATLFSIVATNLVGAFIWDVYLSE